MIFQQSSSIILPQAYLMLIFPRQMPTALTATQQFDQGVGLVGDSDCLALFAPNHTFLQNCRNATNSDSVPRKSQVSAKPLKCQKLNYSITYSYTEKYYIDACCYQTKEYFYSSQSLCLRLSSVAPSLIFNSFVQKKKKNRLQNLQNVCHFSERPNKRKSITLYWKTQTKIKIEELRKNLARRKN